MQGYASRGRRRTIAYGVRTRLARAFRRRLFAVPQESPPPAGADIGEPRLLHLLGWLAGLEERGGEGADGEVP
jgi:hypothetical protein